MAKFPYLIIQSHRGFVLGKNIPFPRPNCALPRTHAPTSLSSLRRWIRPNDPPSINTQPSSKTLLLCFYGNIDLKHTQSLTVQRRQIQLKGSAGFVSDRASAARTANWLGATSVRSSGPRASFSGKRARALSKRRTRN